MGLELAVLGSATFRWSYETQSLSKS